jgi:hypothetical protein
MATEVKRRRGSTTQHSAFTGAEGEITVDLTKDTLVVHDGSTQAGFPLLREDFSNAPAEIDIQNSTIEASEFIGDLRGAVRFKAQADVALAKGDAVYISGISGNTPTVGIADANDASKMPAFGLAAGAINSGAKGEIITFGTLSAMDTSSFTVGDVLYISDTGTSGNTLTATAPAGESSQIQNIGKVQRSHASAGSIKVGGAGRSNATPNLNQDKIFLGDSNNRAVSTALSSINLSSFNDDVVSGSYLPLTGGTISSNLTISGNLTVSGTTTTVNSETINLADNFILLNSNHTGDSPTENAGIEIKRSTDNSANKKFFWNEATDQWNADSALVATSFIKQSNSGGFLKANGTEDTNTYLTSETSHSDVLVDGDFATAGFMKTDGSGTYSVDGSTYLTSVSSSDVTQHLSVVTQSATGGGELSLVNGEFRFKPASVSSFIALTDISVGTNAPASGSGGLAYSNTNGTFTYTPPDLSNFLTAHPSISAASSVDNSAVSVIQDVTLDGNGHLTGLASKDLASEFVPNNANLVVQASASGGGSLTYDTSTKQFTYTPPAAATGDITEIVTNTNSGLNGGTTSGVATLSLNISNLVDMTEDVEDIDQIAILDGTTNKRKALNEIDISVFNNDAGFITSAGDITEVAAGNGLSGGGTSGSVTLSHSDTSSQASVDNSNGSVIQDVTLDTYGHVTGLTSVDLDSRYLELSGGILTGDTKLRGGDLFLDAAAVNGTGNRKIRFTEGSSTSSGFQGGYIYYDGDANKLHLGMHDATDSDTANDLDAITILRSNQNVGIGLNAPTQKLHINKASLSLARFTTTATGLNDTDGVAIGYDDSTGAVFWNRENSNLVFATNNTSRLTIEAGGDIEVANDLNIDGSFTNTNGNASWRKSGNEYTATWIDDKTVKFVKSASSYAATTPYAEHQNFIATFSFKTSNATHLGLVYHGQNSPSEDGYNVIIRSSNTVRVQKRQTNVGQSYLIGGVNGTAISGVDIDDGNWHRVTVQVISQKIRVDIDGNQIINGEINDTTFTEGGVGYIAYDGTVEFNNLEVQEIPSTTFIDTLNLNGISEGASNTVALMWDQGKNVTYRTLGSNAFNSDTIPTASNFLPITGGTLSGGLTVTDTGTGIKIDTAGHATLRLDRASATFDNNILFYTGGTLRWRLWQDGDDDYLYIRDEDNSDNMVTFKKGGNVGIGTTSPSTLLHLESTGATRGIRIGSTLATQYSEIQLDANLREYRLGVGGSSSLAPSSFYVYDNSSNAFRFIINSSGKVGIGTTAPNVAGFPSTTLTVEGSSGNYGAFELGSANQTSNNGRLGEIRFYNKESANPYGFASIRGLRGSSAGDSHISFFTSSSNTPTERMRIDSSGNVGIGNTSPAQKLVVNGGIHAYGNITTPASGTYGLLMDFYIADSRFWSRGTTGGGTRGGFAFYQLEADGTNQITSFALDTSGNASFNYDLDVAGNASIDYSLLGRGFRSANRGEFHLNSTGTNDVSEIFLGYGNGFTEANIRWGISDRGTSTGKLEFYRGPALGGFSSVMTLDGLNKRVGIGTASPSRKLSVNGNAGFGNGTIETIISFSDRGIFGTQSNHDLEIRTNGSEAMRIDSSGNVGIGITNPQTILDLNDGAVSDIRIRGNQTTDLRLGGVAFYNTAGADVVAALNADRDGADDAGALTFDTQPAGGGMTERMRITSAGDVNFYGVSQNADMVWDRSAKSLGIGTNVPTQELHVDGKIRAESWFTGADDTNTLFSSSSAGVLLQTAGLTENNNNSKIFLRNSGATTKFTFDCNSGELGIGTINPSSTLHLENSSSPTLRIKDTTNNVTLLAYAQDANAHIGTYSNHDLIFDSNSVERMRITSAGDVEIGTTTNVATRKLTIDSSTVSKINLDVGNEGTVGNFEARSGEVSIGADTAADLHLKTSGTDQVTIDYIGNVGIGTTSPTAPLHVIGTVRMGNTSEGLTFTAGSGIGNIIGVDTGFAGYNAIALKASANTGIYLDTADNVGIGTTSPDSRLEIESNGSSNSVVTIDANDARGASRFALLVTDSDPNSRGSVRISTASGPSLTTSGNVGIGTTSPSAKLDVAGAIQIGENSATPNIAYGLFGYSGVGLGIYSAASGETQGIGFWLNNGSAYEAGRWLSNGKLGIGTTSPNKNLQINIANNNTNVLTGNGLAGGAAGSGVLIYNSNTTSGVYANLDFRANNADGRIAYKYMGNTNVGDFHFITDNTNSPMSAMVIKNDGNVGIGTTSPSVKLDTRGSISAQLDTAFYRLRRTNGTDVGFITDSTTWGDSGTDFTIGASSSNLRFYTNNSVAERMRIDSSGNVLVGKTAASSATVGFQAGQNGFTAITRTSAQPLVLNRTTTDGIIADFRKDGTTVGSIGVEASDNLFIQAPNGTGLTFPDNSVVPRKNGSNNDNGVDLGHPSVRWKDFYLGGDANIDGDLEVDGNVGINDPTPSASLSIISNDANIIDLSRQNVGTYRLAISSTDKFSVFDVGANTDRLVIDSSGNVGIGTTAPAAKLEINGDTSIRSTNKLYFGQSTSSLGSWTTRMYANGSEHRFNANSFIFNNEGYGTTEYMRITSDGDVGIGTDNPSQKLHVYGENTVARFQSTSSYVDIYLISSGNTGFLNLSSTGLNFYAGGGSGADLKMFIGNSGNVSIADGNLIVAAGHGVDFSANQNNSGMTSELLDDYEEGTFTPTIHAGASNISLASNNYGKYTKVGNVVHCSGRFQASSLTAGSSSTNVELGGLPFTCDAPLSTGTGAVAGSIGFAGGFAGEAATMMQIRDGETNAFLYYQNSSLTVSNVKGNDLGSTTTIVFQITYQTAS